MRTSQTSSSPKRDNVTSFHTFIGRLWWRLPDGMRARLHRFAFTARLKRAFSRFSGYIDAAGQYGLLRGPRIWRRIQHATEAATYPVPGAQHQVAIRPDTEDADVFRSVFLRHECRVPGTMARPPRVIVDGGAYVGYSTVYYALAWPEARVIAVEPEPRNLAQLHTNTKALPNVTVIHGAIWHRHERLHIENPDAASYSFRMSPASGESEGVQAFTVPDLMALAGTDVIDILKLDIEGAEREVFEHAESWIRQAGILCVEVHDRYKPGCTAAFLNAVKTGSFRLLVEHGEKLVAQQTIAQ